MSNNEVSKTIRFPEELFQQLKEMADRQNIPFSQLITTCCEFALGDMSDHA